LTLKLQPTCRGTSARDLPGDAENCRDLIRRSDTMSDVSPEVRDTPHKTWPTGRHDETGRLWQSRLFWEKADAVLDAHGELLKLLHDVRRTATVPSQVADADAGEPPFKKPHASSATVACIVIVWSDGTLTPIVPAATAMLRRGQDGSS